MEQYELALGFLTCNTENAKFKKCDNIFKIDLKVTLEKIFNLDILIKTKNTNQGEEPSEKRMVTSTNRCRRNSGGRKITILQAS